MSRERVRKLRHPIIVAAFVALAGFISLGIGGALGGYFGFCECEYTRHEEMPTFYKTIIMASVGGYNGAVFGFVAGLAGIGIKRWLSSRRR
jgi:hypothetical protein